MSTRLKATEFLSTLSLRRATLETLAGAFLFHISIHALLAESDGLGVGLYLVTEISIHALLAESDAVVDNIVFVPGEFLSTLSLRRATFKHLENRAQDLAFLSTLSLRRATCPSDVPVMSLTISIHALLAESDPVICFIVSVICLFLSTLSLRRATPKALKKSNMRTNFYPRSPCGERR